MTPPSVDPGIEAAAAAIYTQFRATALDQAHADYLPVLQRALPEDFDDLDLDRQQHHRTLARAGVDAWRLHAQLNGTRP